MIRTILAILALLLLAPAAEAASFDCSKAATAFEKAICTHPDASEADDVLAQAYATAIGGLSKPALDIVKADQHGWLDYAARACSDDAQPITTDYTDDQAACLASTINSRVTSLESSRMQGGYRFYPITRYLTEKDEEAEADAYVKTGSKEFETVKIDASSDVAKAFNAFTETMRAGYTDLFKKGTDELETGNTTEDVSIVTKIDSVSDYRITLVTDNYSNYHGAAHGNYGFTYDHFLVRELRPLYASDIFSREGWKETLGKLVYDKLKAEYEDGIWEDAEKDVVEMAADPSRWNFSPEALIVQFQPYDVTAYAAGAPVVTIPWDQLTDLMASGADMIAIYG